MVVKILVQNFNVYKQKITNGGDMERRLRNMWQ